MAESRQIDMDIILQSKLDYYLASDKACTIVDNIRNHKIYELKVGLIPVTPSMNYAWVSSLRSLDPDSVRIANDVICIQRKHKTLIKIARPHNLLALHSS